MNVCEKPGEREGAGQPGTGPNAGFELKVDLKAVRTGIGAALRTLHSDVLREEVPDRIAELLKRLDEPKGADSTLASDKRRQRSVSGPRKGPVEN